MQEMKIINPFEVGFFIGTGIVVSSISIAIILFIFWLLIKPL